MHAMNRGIYNHIAEMPELWPIWSLFKPPHAIDLIPPEQSGFVQCPGITSPHAYDQLPLYETWTYKPMLFRFFDIWQVKEVLGHKTFKTLYYIHLEAAIFKTINDEFTVRTARTVEEARQSLEVGFECVTVNEGRQTLPKT